MLKKARIWVVLALALTLAGTLLGGIAKAHSGDFHGTAVAEGGSSLFVYNPPGPDPQQEFWLDAMASIVHTVKADGKDYYRPTFKLNSWRGVFSEDDSIWAAPGDAQAVDYTIRACLYLRDTETGALTLATSNCDSWITSGNGWSYGCAGTGREAQINPQATKEVVVRLTVRGERKFFYNGNWYSSGQGSGYNQTSSYRMSTVWVAANPPMMGHVFSTDPLSGYFIGVPNLPAGTLQGYCPLWTTVL